MQRKVSLFVVKLFADFKPVLKSEALKMGAKWILRNVATRIWFFISTYFGVNWLNDIIESSANSGLLWIIRHDLTTAVKGFIERLGGGGYYIFMAIDTDKAVQALKSAGVKKEQARGLIDQLLPVNNDIVTKDTLQAEVQKLKPELIMWRLVCISPAYL